jgi:hypothetical protein
MRIEERNAIAAPPIGAHSKWPYMTLPQPRASRRSGYSARFVFAGFRFASSASAIRLNTSHG